MRFCLSVFVAIGCSSTEPVNEPRVEDAAVADVTTPCPSFPPRAGAECVGNADCDYNGCNGDTPTPRFRCEGGRWVDVSSVCAPPGWDTGVAPLADSADEWTATPVLMPAPGTYAKPVDVTINCATKDAVIYFTTDGTDPNTSSPKYSAPISITARTTVKAMAVAFGAKQSATVTGVYEIAP